MICYIAFAGYIIYLYHIKHCDIKYVFEVFILIGFPLGILDRISAKEAAGFRSGSTGKKIFASLYYIFTLAVGYGTYYASFTGSDPELSAAPPLLCFVMLVLALWQFVFVFEMLTDKEGRINNWLHNKGCFVNIVVKIFQFMFYSALYSIVYYILVIIMARYIYHIAI